MKYLFFLILICSPSVLLAQHIDVTPAHASSDNNSRSFTFHESTLLVQGSRLTVTGPDNQIQLPQSYSFSISPKRRYLGALYIDSDLRAALIDGRGILTGDIELTYFDPFDETLKISMFDDGSFITRDNVANFSFFDPEGSLLYSISNSSGSTDGEVASEIAADPSGNTVLLYNPRINYPSSEGSRARIVRGEENIRDIYSSRERTIKSADITRNGSYLALITEQAGTPDEVVVTDRFGNKLASFDTEENLSGTSLSEDGRTITIYSSNRVQVFRLDNNMETVGSASTRSTVNYATYDEQEQQIIALCGVTNNKEIKDPEIQVIHLEKRSIASTDITFPLSYLELNHLAIDRIGASQFMMTGLNRDLRIETSF